MADDSIVAEYRLNVAATQKALADINARLGRVEDAGKKSAKGVEDSFTKMSNNLTSQFKQVGAGIAGAFTVTAIVKSTINTMMEFEHQMAKVKAVSGATASEMEKLEANAKKLGASTEYTASQVGQLQEEYARLGFSSKEILAATEATLDLATATGSTLAESAEVAGSTVRGFGLLASDTVRVTDVMAMSFSKSALNMERFRESMKLVSPIARSANIDLETVTALLGQLANAGLSGSIAGTALKNLLSKLSDANSELSQEIGFTVKNSEDLTRAFKELATRNIDLTKATELTDERSKAAFITLFNGVDTVKSLETALKNAEGATKEMADIMRNNLTNDVKALESAWEGLVLQVTDTRPFRTATQLLTSYIQGLQKSLMTDDQMVNQSLEDATERAQFAAKAATERISKIKDEDQRIKELNSTIAIFTQEMLKAEEAVNLFTKGGSVVPTTSESKNKLSMLKQEVIFTKEMVDALTNYRNTLKNTGDDSTNSTAAQIRNYAFLTAELKRLEEELKNNNKTYAENQATVAKMKAVQAELDALLGKSKGSVKDLREEYEKLTASMTDAVEKFKLSREEAALEAIEIDALRQKLIALRANESGTEADAKTRAEALLAIERDRLNKRIELLKRFGRDNLPELIAQAEAEIAVNEKNYKEASDDYQRFLEGQREDYENYLKLKAEADERAQQKERERLQNEAAFRNELLNALNEAINLNLNLRLAAISEEQAALDRQLRNREITQEQFEARQLQLRRKAAQAQKDAATFSAITGTATAIINALQMQPFPVALAFAAIAAAMGGAQIASIQSQPLPQFEHGGWVEGKPHALGGTPIEAEKGEFIINRKSARKHAELIEAINEDRIPEPQQGWDNIMKAIQLNAMFNDRNLITAIDRHREADRSGMMFMTEAIVKAVRSGGNSRRTWN